jgi:hypothetical protein
MDEGPQPNRNVRIFCRYLEKTGRSANIAMATQNRPAVSAFPDMAVGSAYTSSFSRLARRPAVRCKRFRQAGVSGLASMYPVFDWSCFAPDHHGYQRACGLIIGQTSNGPVGSPVFARAGKTDPPSLLILSQTSAGNG